MRTSMATLIAALLVLRASGEAQTIGEIELTACPEAIASFGAAPHDGWIYVLGGHTGRAHHHSRENLSRRFFRIRMDEPTRIETLPGGEGLQGLALIAAGDHLFRVGGLRATNHPEDDPALHSEDSVIGFDVGRKIWRDLSPLPSPRSSHDAIALDGTIYVFGGWNLQRDDESWFDEGCAAAVGGDELVWRSIPQPFRRRAVALAAHEARIWVVGGLTEDGKPSRRVDVYSPSDGSWTRGPDLPSMGFGASAFATPRGLFVSLLNGALLRLANDGRSWFTVGHSAIPRFFSRLVSAGKDRLACIAGSGRLGHMSTVEWMTLGPDADIEVAAGPTPENDGAVETPAASRGGTARERIGHFPLDDGTSSGPGPVVTLKLDYPAAARNRQIVFRDGNDLFLFGGNTSLGQHDFERRNFATEGVRIDLATLAIEVAPSLPRPLQSSASLVTGSDDHARAFVVGGFGHDAEGDAGARSRDEIFAYEPTRRRWSRRGTLPVPLTQFGMVERKDELWIFGGLDYDRARGRDTAFAHSDKVYRATAKFSDDLRFEETEFTMPTPRRAFGGAMLGDRYYIAGGMREDFELVRSFLAFDFETGDWSELPSPGPRISPHLVPVGGRLYLVGGSELDEDLETTPSTTIEVFDPATSSWSVHPQRLPLDPRHLHVMEVAGRLLLLSTRGEEGVLDVRVLRP